MEENNKSLISVNNSLAKIEKQIAIGEKILEIANQSFLLLISRDFHFQTMSIEDYKNVTANLIFNKKNENVFIENLISIELVTRTFKIIFFTKFGKYFSTAIGKILKIKDLKDLFTIEIQDEIVDVVLIDDLNNIKGKQLFFVTQNGFVKKTKIKLFIDEILTSELAIKLNEYDFLVKVKIVDINSLIVISSKFGQLFYNEAFKIKSSPKNSFGYIQGKLAEGNNIVVGLAILENSEKYYDVIFVSEKDYVRKEKVTFSYVNKERSHEVKAAIEELNNKQNEENLLKGLFVQNQQTQSSVLNNSIEDWKPVFSKNRFISYVEILQDETIFLLLTNKKYFYKFKADDIKINNLISNRIRFPDGTKINDFYENEHVQAIVKLPNLINKTIK
ncbi:hypothetical protein [Flavobacterium sp. 83]|uniref:hypothetical protein n=1 Tax=Flavobacterium sp. 83 TaxID=1131812 RepID=UPI00054D5519|nr:hypothetical protein [Flavobacterium sp. 83]